MKQPIVTDIKFLRKRSEEVDEARAHGIFSILNDSLEGIKGYGLCAIQIGVPLRVSIIRLPKCKLDLWNPKIIEKSGRFRFQGEGCLSIPGLFIDTARYNDIVVENGDGRRYSLSGMEAIVCQHEIDHMNGRLFMDAKWRKKR